jgi:hypothetical protein
VTLGVAPVAKTMLEAELPASLFLLIGLRDLVAFSVGPDSVRLTCDDGDDDDNYFRPVGPPEG